MPRSGPTPTEDVSIRRTIPEAVYLAMFVERLHLFRGDLLQGGRRYAVGWVVVVVGGPVMCNAHSDPLLIDGVGE